MTQITLCDFAAWREKKAVRIGGGILAQGVGLQTSDFRLRASGRKGFTAEKRPLRGAFGTGER